MHRMAAVALDRVGLTRRGRSRWVVSTEELDWSVVLDRGASSRSWAVEFAACVRAWSSDGVEHLRQDYAAHSGGVPPSAAAYRWDDHASYFTAALDHGYDGPAALPEDERAVAFAFMAGELSALFATVRDVPSLVAEVHAGRLGGAVHRRLQALVDG